MLTMYDAVIEHLQNGGLIAYPTEAVFGLGCDPDNEEAVRALLALKERDPAKGLILVAASYSQALRFIRDNDIPQDRRFAVFSRWPGPVTWVMPAKAEVPFWLKGDHDSLAVRVSDHPLVRSLCDAYGKPLVSTSCNKAGEPPLLTAEAVRQQFGDAVLVVDGEVGGLDKPTSIFDAITGEQLRG
ncbi:Sua5/YciO/YrdC/YwlC family protein [Gallaecimonas kandeliae]|uniref:Sua5/YciO/YrdC/YwlC family protein n=1 Tax=Gallaecimonas kandeliae TaxID=3029055 RepID=UPI002649D220|nr:Sua5/YciO/YrdC/YwlC family protein [Gallaecimonas kandeliae]WKE65702.1 Sua5/YciO/YrdC/YwlC family protein [Gallaecimonas kandeliae]